MDKLINNNIMSLYFSYIERSTNILRYKAYHLQAREMGKYYADND